MADGIIIRPYQPMGTTAYAARSATPFGDMDPPRYVATDRKPMGMVEPGNINIMDRPSVANPAGGRSTVYSMSFQDDDGNQVLVPLVTDKGTIDTPDQAVARYEETGRHLGKFSPAAGDTPSAFADAYAEQLHEQQERMVTGARATAALAAWGL
jgi:hypothetical protein